MQKPINKISEVINVFLVDTTHSYVVLLTVSILLSYRAKGQSELTDNFFSLTG